MIAAFADALFCNFFLAASRACALASGYFFTSGNPNTLKVRHSSLMYLRKFSVTTD